MRTLLACSLIALLGCGAPATSPPHDGGPAPSSTLPRGRTGTAPLPAPRSDRAHGARIAIPAGRVLAGSLPGTPGRRPSREADEIAIALPAYEIDRLPFPNDPLAPPTLVASRAEAAALCESTGARLCTELEWERACESERNDRFAGGATFDPDRCGDPMACATREGVLRMGDRAPEWTASDVPSASIRMGRTAVQRGARADAPAELHRCAARTFEVPADAAPSSLRCCHGPAGSPSYPDVTMHREIRDLAVDRDAVRAALRATPQTAPYADSFVPYGIEEGDRALARGDVGRGALGGWELAPGPFAWSPSPGEEAWVLAGSAAGATLIAILYPLPDGRFAHAASLVLEGEEVPIAIARTPPSRTELQWSACWGCPGESGVIRFDDDAVIRVITR
jgi:hypothetical protein